MPQGLIQVAAHRHHGHLRIQTACQCPFQPWRQSPGYCVNFTRKFPFECHRMTNLSWHLLLSIWCCESRRLPFNKNKIQIFKLGDSKTLLSTGFTCHIKWFSFGQKYLWIDKPAGGLSSWPPRFIFSLCQQLFNYRKIEDDFAGTVSVIYFVLNSWSTKKWTSGVCGGWATNVQRWPQDPYFPFSPLVLYFSEVLKCETTLLSFLIPSSTLLSSTLLRCVEKWKSLTKSG